LPFRQLQHVSPSSGSLRSGCCASQWKVRPIREKARKVVSFSCFKVTYLNISVFVRCAPPAVSFSRWDVSHVTLAFATALPVWSRERSGDRRSSVFLPGRGVNNPRKKKRNPPRQPRACQEKKSDWSHGQTHSCCEFIVSFVCLFSASSLRFHLSRVGDAVSQLAGAVTAGPPLSSLLILRLGELVEKTRRASAEKVSKNRWELHQSPSPWSTVTLLYRSVRGAQSPLGKDCTAPAPELSKIAKQNRVNPARFAASPSQQPTRNTGLFPPSVRYPENDRGASPTG